jgi:hypothetical protein
MGKRKSLGDNESGHWRGWGDLLSERGRLLNLGDLVRYRCRAPASPVPLRPAAAEVLDALQTRDEVPVFITQPGTWAAEARADWPVLREGSPGKEAWVQYNTGTNRVTGQRRPPIHHPARPEVPRIAGRAGLLATLRRRWERGAFEPADLYSWLEFYGGQLAILWRDALVLFPHCVPAEPGDHAAAPAAAVVSIDGAARRQRAPAPAPAEAGQAAQGRPAAGGPPINLPPERWKDARGRWTDELLDRVSHLNTSAGGEYSMSQLAAALGVKRASLEEALKRQSERRDRERSTARPRAAA